MDVIELFSRKELFEMKKQLVEIMGFDV